jgi:biofilm PGA synthesis N-glycosyltransferase PgaC
VIAHRLRLLVVVPFLNEAEHLATFLASIDAQERLPDHLLLVDDGSTDGSSETAARFVAARAYARLLRRPPRPPDRDRLAAAQELRAFTWGLERADVAWDVAAKLDADLRLATDAFAELERRFLADPRLGIAGTFVSQLQRDGSLGRQRCPDGHVEGPTKFYRRECLADIAPLPAIVGWETIDETRAQMRGWRCASIAPSNGDTVHLRRMGSYDGVLRGYARMGLAAWSYGSHPLHVLAAAANRLRDRPAPLCAAAYLVGYLRAAAARAPRAEAELRAYVRRAQLARLRGWPTTASKHIPMIHSALNERRA